MKKFKTLRQAEAIAKKKANRKSFIWLQSGAEDEYTLRKNFKDLEKIKIKPKLLNRIEKVDISTNFFKQKIDSPIILAPMGHQTQFHRLGEIETANGANKIKILSFYGTQSRMKLDQISSNKLNKSLIGWTIFPFGDLQWILKQIKNAEINKCNSIVLCLDANIRSHRYSDRETSYDARKIGIRTNPVSPNPKKSLTYDWSLIKFLKNKTKLPIIAKGILTAEDCKLAFKNKADGIWISNHGGRMFNSGISSVEALIEIKKKINLKNKLVIADGGIRKGTDVIKYLCLGANLVAVGRPAIYGLICNGSQGVSNIFSILKKELTSAMTNGGFKNISSFKQNRLII